MESIFVQIKIEAYKKSGKQMFSEQVFLLVHFISLMNQKMLNFRYCFNFESLGGSMVKNVETMCNKK